jgi:hypothetical protein
MEIVMPNGTTIGIGNPPKTAAPERGPVQIVVDVEIRGIAPLLQHNIDGGEEQMLRKGKRKTGGVMDNPEEWRGFVYKLKDGKLGHPSAAIENALENAARDFKADKRRSMRDVIKALVYTNEPMAVLNRTEPDDVFRASVVNPNTKGRGFRYRPLFREGWVMSFSLTIADTEIVEVSRVKEILDYAGYRIGVGNWRPKFGRFLVQKFVPRGE